MPHIHTEPGQHDHTISAFIVRIGNNKPKLLLHKHKLLDKYLQIGGHVELHEHPWQSLAHEILEESGYELNQLNLLQPQHRIKSISRSILHPVPLIYSTHPFSNTHNHIDTAFVFVTNELPKHKVAKGESTELRWFSHDDLNKLTNKETFKEMQEIGEYIFKICLPNWEQVQATNFVYK